MSSCTPVRGCAHVCAACQCLNFVLLYVKRRCAEQVQVPKCGQWFEFDGHRIRVPARWPLKPRIDGQGTAGNSLLGHVIKTVLGDRAIAVRTKGFRGRWVAQQALHWCAQYTNGILVSNLLYSVHAIH